MKTPEVRALFTRLRDKGLRCSQVQDELRKRGLSDKWVRNYLRGTHGDSGHDIVDVLIEILKEVEDETM